MPTTPNTLRVTFSDEALCVLTSLERRTGKPAGDLLAEALALLDKAVEVTQAGGQLLVERDGERFVLVAPPPSAAVLTPFPSNI